MKQLSMNSWVIYTYNYFLSVTCRKPVTTTTLSRIVRRVTVKGRHATNEQASVRRDVNPGGLDTLAI